MIQPFVYILLWSAVLVIIFFPLYKKIKSKIKSPSLSSILTIIIIVLIFILPLIGIAIAMVQEATSLVSIYSEPIQNFFKNIDRNPSYKEVYNYINHYFNINQFVHSDELKGFLARISETVVQMTITFVGGFAGTLVSLFFAFFTMYYLFRDGEKIAKKLLILIPVEESDAQTLLDKTSESINASIYGSIFIASIQGVMGGTMFWILGIPAPILLGLLMMILAILPMGGTGFVWLPAAIILAISGDWSKAIILVAYGILAIGLIDNFLMPRIVGKRTKMHELFIFFSVLGGIQLFGLLGLFLGPVILAVTISLLKVFRGEENLL